MSPRPDVEVTRQRTVVLTRPAELVVAEPTTRVRPDLGSEELAGRAPLIRKGSTVDGVPVVVPRSLLVPSLAIALTPNSYFWPFVRPLTVADGDVTVPPLIQVLDPYGGRRRSSWRCFVRQHLEPAR